MTGKPAPRRRAQPPEPKTDPWQTWFSKVVQVAGLGIVIYEVRWEHNDRPWVLLVAAAMMTGLLGLQALVRWLLERMR